jgi:signal peptidase I
MNSRAAVPFVIVALLAVTGCRKSVQSSSAMAPTINPGERVTIDFLAYGVSGPRRWDVVTLEPPASTNIMVLKRVIGLPGERISLTASGIVVNGSILSMPVALSNVAYGPPESLLAAQAGGLVAFPYTVPPKHYFLVGDNWTNSYDSRHYGAIALTNILGRVKNK